MVDLIIYNAVIRTQDLDKPIASAAAVKGDKFVAIGSNEEVLGLTGRETNKIDLGGRLVLPGFTDSHFHFYDWALGRKWIDFSACSSLADFIATLRKVVEKDDTQSFFPGGWVLGQKWNESEWPEGRTPTRTDLDSVSKSKPIIAWRSDLHLAVVNSKALELAGIGDNTRDPDFGRLGRDPSGSLNGILQDRAIDLVKGKIPVPGEGDVAGAMHEGIPVLHAMGITGLHDFRLMDGKDGAPSFKALQILDKEGTLELRVWMCLSWKVLEEAVRIGLKTGMGSENLRIGHIKIFADGSVGARTAWVSEPYIDGGSGFPLMDMEELAGFVKLAQSSGLSVAVHAIGDRANHELINMFHTLKQQGFLHPAQLTAPHRIEHLQLLRTEDIQLLSKLDIMGSVHPAQLVDDIILSEKCLGPRANMAFRFRDLLDHGIDLAFGSDCPVADPNPLVGIHAAVTRQHLDGSPEGGWHPEQRISVQEAVKAYTSAPAHITGRGHALGSISAGKLADFVVLEKDIFNIPPETIPDVNIDMTFIGGRIVYQR